MEHKAFTWFGALGLPDTIATLATAGLVAGLLVAFAAAAHRRLAPTEAAVDPEDGVTVRGIAEVVAEFIDGVAAGVIGHGAERYVALLGTFFVFILLANLIGLVPGFTPPTSEFRITFALGLVSFLAYHAAGLREHGPKYFKQFLGPLLALAPIMIVVEMFSHAFRPMSLGVRLYANMFADHTLVEIFTGLTRLLVPVAFYVLGAFVCVVQAFVFTLLSTIYIALAVSHEH
jgi:F-type H+-transporting ATPase subunit a